MDAKLNHSDLSALLAKQAEISGAKAEIFTKAFFEIISEGLEQDGIVKINGLGTFKVTDVASRSSVDVNTGEKIEIKGHKKLTFLPADSLKEKVNQPFAMFEPVEIDDSYVDDNDEPVTNETETQEDAPAAENASITAPEEEDSTAENVLNTECAEPVEVPTATEETEGNVQEAAPEPVFTEIVEKCTPAEEITTAPAEAEEENTTNDVAQKKVKNSYPITKPAVTVEEPATKKTPTVIYTLFIIAAILVAVVIYFRPQLFGDVATENKATATTATTPTGAVEVVKPDSIEIAVEKPTDEPYVFAMLDELAAKSVGSITRGDTLLYVADDTIATHTVAADETLVRISLKYYGDKRLWPYIVQYNKLDNPNGLNKGMDLLIPRLQPAK